MYMYMYMYMHIHNCYIASATTGRYLDGLFLTISWHLDPLHRLPAVGVDVQDVTASLVCLSTYWNTTCYVLL